MRGARKANREQGQPESQQITKEAFVESPNQVQEHIDTILKNEQDFRARRTASDRLGDSIAAFVGSLRLVVIHITVFAARILLNTLRTLAGERFDPFPFSLLGTCVSLEAILVASFILMRQARLARGQMSMTISCSKFCY